MLSSGGPVVTKQPAKDLRCVWEENARGCQPAAQLQIHQQSQTGICQGTTHCCPALSLCSALCSVGGFQTPLQCSVFLTHSREKQARDTDCRKYPLNGQG